MSSQRFICSLYCLAILPLLTSCGQKKVDFTEKKVPVVPVTVTVTVDGKPEPGVHYHCHPVGDFPVKEKADAISGVTDSTGKIDFKLYFDQSGIPPADYAVIFYWPPASVKKHSRKEDIKADQFKQKYAKVEKAPLKFKVESGAQKLELEPLDLKTK